MPESHELFLIKFYFGTYDKDETPQTPSSSSEGLFFLIKFYFGTYDKDETPQTPSSSSDGYEHNGIDFENHSSNT